MHLEVGFRRKKILFLKMTTNTVHQPARDSPSTTLALGCQFWEPRWYLRLVGGRCTIYSGLAVYSRHKLNIAKIKAETVIYMVMVDVD